jgi:pimeloyl-ACP methyl ester carboxylesterase
MILDLSGDKNLTIDLHNRDYFVTISGNGFPCLSIGLGSIAQRTLSKKFKENFCVYSSDWFWDKKSQLIKKETLSLDLVIDETIKLSQKLGLEKPILIGHSAWGILALEIAKQYPDFASDLLLIGTPPPLEC